MSDEVMAAIDARRLVSTGLVLWHRPRCERSLLLSELEAESAALDA